MIPVIVDTKEKQPWTFNSFPTISTTASSLKTGDYTIDGMEDILCIERKKSVAEFAQNITQARFLRELVRMKDFSYRFILLEFDLRHVDDFPMELPFRVRSIIKVNSAFIMKKIVEIQIKYDINILMCSNRGYAENMAYSIIKMVASCERNY